MAIGAPHAMTHSKETGYTQAELLARAFDMLCKLGSTPACVATAADAIP